MRMMLIAGLLLCAGWASAQSVLIEQETLIGNEIEVRFTLYGEPPEDCCVRIVYDTDCLQLVSGTSCRTCAPMSRRLPCGLK